MEKKLAGAVKVSYFKIPFCTEISEKSIDQTAVDLLRRTLAELTPFDSSCIVCCDELAECLSDLVKQGNTPFWNYGQENERERILKSILGRFNPNADF